MSNLRKRDKGIGTALPRPGPARALAFRSVHSHVKVKSHPALTPRARGAHLFHTPHTPRTCHVTHSRGSHRRDQCESIGTSKIYRVLRFHQHYIFPITQIPL